MKDKNQITNPAWTAEVKKVLDKILENAVFYDWEDLEMLRKFSEKKYNEK